MSQSQRDSIRRNCDAMRQGINDMAAQEGSDFMTAYGDTLTALVNTLQQALCDLNMLADTNHDNVNEPAAPVAPVPQPFVPPTPTPAPPSA